MASGPSAAVANQLRAMFQGGTVGGLTDGQLLERFVQRRDEAAFAALVERHGPMVLRVCSNRLGDPHDAEDAFQATFLVLARKARSIRQSEAVAGWLFGVAGRVSARVRAAGLRRVRAEQKAGISRDLGSEDRPLETWTELYEELDRLPEKFRLPLILCYLEGLTYEQAAAQLCCPVRTIQSRLVRGRELMKGRLARRGLAPSAAIFAPALSMDGAKSIVPVSLKQATAAAAMRFMIGEGMAAGEGPAGALASEVLAHHVTRPDECHREACDAAGGGRGQRLAGPAGDAPHPARSVARSRRGSSASRSASGVGHSQEGRESFPYDRGRAGRGNRRAGRRRSRCGSNLRGDYPEALTDSSGRYTIPLPEGSARPFTFSPPPGYWLPDPASHMQFFAATPQQPVHRKDYVVRRGTPWMFRLTRGPKHEPVDSGVVSTFTIPGECNIYFSEKTDPRGITSITLPDEAARTTISVTPRQMDEGMGLVKLDKGQGFRPGAVRDVKRIEEAGEPRFRLTDEAGGNATVTGPVEPIVVQGRVMLSVTLPELDPDAFGNVTGTVVDQDNRPVAGATVTCFFTYRTWGMGSGRDKVQTDALGRYVLRSVPRRSYEGDPTKLFDHRVQGGIRRPRHGRLRVQARWRRDAGRASDPARSWALSGRKGGRPGGPAGGGGVDRIRGQLGAVHARLPFGARWPIHRPRPRPGRCPSQLPVRQARLFPESRGGWQGRTDYRPAPPDAGTPGGRGRPAGAAPSFENWRNGSQLGRPRLDRRQGSIDRRAAR